jgi:outer membrane protein assembly factor BamB
MMHSFKNVVLGALGGLGLLGLLACVLPIAPVAGAEPPVKKNCDWPYFLGPNRNATANDTGLLREWPAEGPPVLWKAPIGIGWASISSAGDDAIVASMDGPGETVRCLDVKTGKEKWNHGYQLNAPPWAWGVGWDKGGTRCTPSISDKYIWTCGILGDVYCLDRKTGAVVWRRGFLDGQKPKNPGDWKGYHASPLIVGNTLFWSGNQGGEIVANAWFADSGKDAWTFKEAGKPGLRGGSCQAAIAKFGNDDCFVMVINKDLKAVRATDGKEIYKQEFFAGRGTGLPTPTVVDNYVLGFSDADYARLIELDRTKEPYQGKEVWKVNHLAKRWTNDDPYVSFYHSWVYHDGYFYGFVWPELDMGEGFGKSPTYLICVELKTGKMMWSESGFLQGTSLIEADGLLFVRSHQKLMLVECNPKAFTLKGKLEKLHDKPNDTNPGQIDWTMPTIANGRLYLRLPTELICYDIKDHKKEK